MTETLFTIHSYVRYLVLLAGLGAVVTALLGWKSAGLPPRAERALAGAFVGLLDLQVLLGILLIIGVPFYGALAGHIMMMLLAAASAHTASILARRREPARSGSPARLIGFALALLLIVGGIMAIQRSVI